MKYLLTLAIIAFLGFSSVLGQATCPSTQGQAAFINSTADLSTYSSCTSLSGIVFGGNFNNQNISLPNLQMITRLTGGGFGIVIQGTNLISITFPALTNFDSDQFRLIDNSQLSTFSAPLSIAVTSVSNVEVVFQNNPVLVDFTVGFNVLGSSGSITVGGGTQQGLDGAAGTLNFPYLTTVGSDIRITNNGITSTSKASLNIQMPALTAAFSLRLVNNSISAINVGAAGGVTTQDSLAVTGNIKLSNFNVLLASAPNILFSGNGASNQPTYNVALDLITRTVSNIDFLNNVGLTGISFAKLQYADSPITISGNTQLTSLSMPAGIIINQGGLIVTNNGQSGINGVLGVQNITTDSLTITGNQFTTLTFPQLLYIGIALTMTGNTFAQSVSFPASFQVAGSVIIGTNAANLIDLSGLVTSPSVAVTNNVGTGSNPTIQFAQLYNSPSIQITGNTVFTDLILGGLGFIGSLSSSNTNSFTYTAGAANNLGLNLNINNNAALLRVRTYARNNAWSAQAIQIANNPALTTVDLTGLSEAAYLEVDAVTTTNTLANVTANDLTCAGQAIISAGNGGNNALRTTNFLKLSRASYFNVPQAISSCTSNFPSSVGQLSCTAACATCTSSSATSCNNPSTSLTNLICGGSTSSSANPLAASTCVGPSYVAPTYTGQTSLTANTVPTSGGSTGNTGNSGTGSNNSNNSNTGSNNSNNSGTNSNNSNTGTNSGTNSTATSNNNGNNGKNGASSVVMSVAVMVAAALFFM